MAGLLTLQLILMMGLGVLSYKLHFVKDDFVPQLSAVVMNIVLPCMIISTMAGSMSLEEVRECIWLPVLATAILAVLFFIGWVIFRLKKRTLSGRILWFGTMFSNFTFMGVPVIQVLYGDEMSAYFMVFLIVIRAALYYLTTLLRDTSADAEARSWKDKLKSFLSPAMIAMCVAILMNVFGIGLPDFLYNVMKPVGATCTPLGMLICGISLSKYSPKKLLRPYQLWVVALRNIVLPAACLAACLVLNLEDYMTKIAVIFTALPISTMTNMFTVRYNPDNTEAHFESAGVVLATTIASVATIPMWAAVLERVL